MEEKTFVQVTPSYRKIKSRKFVAVRHREPIWQWPWTRKREGRWCSFLEWWWWWGRGATIAAPGRLCEWRSESCSSPRATFQTADSLSTAVVYTDTFIYCCYTTPSSTPQYLKKCVYCNSTTGMRQILFYSRNIIIIKRIKKRQKTSPLSALGRHLWPVSNSTHQTPPPPFSSLRKIFLFLLVFIIIIFFFYCWFEFQQFGDFWSI